jgi:hypothetical protein
LIRDIRETLNWAPRQRDGWQRQKCRCQPLSCLAVCERHSDVTGCVAGAKAHQHTALLVGAGCFKRVANVTGFRNILSGDLQNHVTLFKPTIGSRALRFYLRDNDAFLACAVVRWGKGEAQMRNVGTLGRSFAVGFTVGLGSLSIWQLTKVQTDDLALALVQNVQLDGATR